MKRHDGSRGRWTVSFLVWAVISIISLAGLPGALAADDSLCARVKIEIRQEMTLERQAFEAHMTINNGLSHISLENIGVTVQFKDEEGASVIASSDPGNTEAKFFIGRPELTGVADVTGLGNIGPSSVADIRWLIIPAPGAAKGTSQGTLYYVGATLAYTMGGEARVMDVAPDRIAVRPMPEMVIDYFLTKEVYGDDPFTLPTEPPVPFSLGIRVRNVGRGVANGMKINSAQPKIIENTQQLMIGFNIENAEINDRLVPKSLLSNLGEIGPGCPAMVRWLMTCSLSGQFVEFTADFTHSDELGGEMTSLIVGGPYNHWLVRDVTVDLSGRDEIRDFLALDGNTLRVYESDNTPDTAVADQSGASLLQDSGDVLFLSVPITAGFVYVKLPDPNGGEKEIREVIRSDGKRIKQENVWISKTRRADHTWAHFFNLFDINNPGGYTVFLGEPSESQTPVLEFIPDRHVVEGQSLSFFVQASTPGGAIPTLRSGTLPAGATFTDQRNGQGLFAWNTAVGQAGPYGISITAANGALEISQQSRIIVHPTWDTDGDGMADTWEMRYFGSLVRDGTGDFDGDGINDLDEYLRGWDPMKKDPNPGNRGPSTPRIQSPGDKTETESRQPVLTVLNATDPDGNSLRYVFEIYTDQEMNVLVAGVSDVAEGTGTTSWQLPAVLDDHGHYFWRVRVTDGILFSPWAYGSFFVNAANEAPGSFRVSYPRDHGVVGTRMPVLQVVNAQDADADDIVYSFFLHADIALLDPVASTDNVAAGKDGTTSWTVNVRLADGTPYYWKAVATDEHGATREAAVSSLIVKIPDSAPSSPVIRHPVAAEEITVREADLVVTHANGADGDSLIIFELDKANTFDSPALRSQSVPPGAGTTSWHVDSLDDHSWYSWRAKAVRGEAESPWRQGRFFVNTINEAPAAPIVRNPGTNSWENTCLPVLAVNPARDIDGDRIVYRFELYGDPAYAVFIERKESDLPEFAVSQLMDNAWYYWRAKAVDEHGAESPWTETAAFFVKDSGVIASLRIALFDPWQEVATNGIVGIRWEGASSEGNAEVSLHFDTDSIDANGTLIVSGLRPHPGGNVYLLDTTLLQEGGYYIYGTIASGGRTTSAYSPARITVDRTPPAVSATPPAGPYKGAQTVVLSSSEEGTIYFTLDGSDPTDAAAVYDTPVRISETTTLKAAARDRAGNRSAVITASYAIQQDFTVTAMTSSGRKIGSLRVYAFTAAGGYTGKSVVTDAEGVGRFDPAQFASGVYRFRVDYMGYPFWSNAVTLPGAVSTILTIQEAEMVVRVQTAGPVSGIAVHLFTDGGAYLGISLQTDSAGMATLNVPVGGKYKFRADILGSRYWSPVTTIAEGASNNVIVAAGGGVLQVTVSKGAEDRLPGMQTYLFGTGGAYLGQSRVTDALGMVHYNVPAGSYNVRTDYLGAQFWSGTIAVSGDTSAALTIVHQDVGITVNGVFRDTAVPIGGITAYLFNPAGLYLGLNRQTDGNGRAVFNLPPLECRVRVDYLGRQFWSEPFKGQDAVLNLALADAVATVSGNGRTHARVPVYVLNMDGSYLGLSDQTDENGAVSFRLPPGPFRFRADYQTHQYWSEAVMLTVDETKTVNIATGADDLTLTVRKGKAEPLEGVSCYVFTASGSYLGVSGTTNDGGQVSFSLSAGSYRFRVDYMGYPFWSPDVTMPETTSLAMLIEEAEATVQIRTAGGPAAGIQVHLYTEGGAHLGVTGQTDASGMAAFLVPAGRNYKFRADILGSQHWSPAVTMAGGVVNNVQMAVGGGFLRATVLGGKGNPMMGMMTHLFSAAGRYLNRSQSTDVSGAVQYAVPAGTYRIRADYLENQFWSEPVVMDDGSRTVELSIAHRDVVVAVNGVFRGTAVPMKNVNVCLFTSAGSYLGQNRRTDETGHLHFSLPQVTCKVRVDYLGQAFWSGPFTWQDSVVNIPLADAAVLVTGSDRPRSGVPVYAFGETGTYLNIFGKTDLSGSALFRLPEGRYKFRADYQTHQYWSVAETLVADDLRTVGITTGGGSFGLTVLKGVAEPVVGATCHVFDLNGSNIGISGATDSSGVVTFDLSPGPYKFRTDYMGYPFWSDSFNVPDATSAVMTIPHRNVAVTVRGVYPTTMPLAGVATYLFTPEGGYLNQNVTTAADGLAVYRLPDAAYKARVDYLGYPFWSDAFRGENASVTIPQGTAVVRARRGGVGLAGATVHLFTEGGAYLGRSETSDAGGKTAFIIPNQVYSFRIDSDGRQYWSPPVHITAGTENSVDVNCD